LRRRKFEKRNKNRDTSAFYVEPANISGSRVVFAPEEEHHIREVLRLGKGSVVEVLDGCGGRFRVLLENGEAGDLTGRILEAERKEPDVPALSAAIALGRKERMRIAVEKLAELGCRRIFPLLTDYVSVKRFSPGQMENLRRVCRSALKQSRGWFLTRIEEPLSFENFMKLVHTGEINPVFCRKKEQDQSTALPRSLSPELEHVLVVGPEGGFSPEELALIDRSGAPCIHLGETILRFETAAVAGFVLLRQILLGDISIYSRAN